MAARTSTSQRRTIGRVMHEAKHGELKSGRGGAGGKVKSRKQAIAIALHEAGASKYDSSSERTRSYARTKSKEAHGRTAQQAKEGKLHVGARGHKESSSAMRAKSPTSRSARSKGSTARSRAAAKAGRASGRARRAKGK